MSRTRIIPVDRLQEGMNLCARNIRGYLQDVQKLLDNPHDCSDWHAVMLAIFAFEELAKFAQLKEAKARAATGNVEIDDQLFSKHKYKQELAGKLIDKKSLKLIDKTSLEPSFRGETVTITPSLRLDCAFVDWENDQWTHGTPLIPNNLRKFKESIAQALCSLETENHNAHQRIAI